MFDRDNAKGLRVDVYSGTYKSPNCVFNREDGPASLTIVAIDDRRDRRSGALQALPSDSQVFAPSDKAPAAVLVLRDIRGHVLVSVEPLQADGESKHYAMGGAYTGTSDSRWDALIPFYGAVALHDYRDSGM